LSVFLDASFRLTLPPDTAAFWARMATFGAIGLGGGLGCVLGGLLSDRIGRTAMTMGAMTASGASALIVGFLFGAEPWLLFAVCFVWGGTIIADSAQFSTSIAELSEPELIGTMLTVQTCAGFLLTLATIHLMPPLVDALGWRYAFMPLAIGPAFGVWSMYRLRVHPDGLKLAGGRR
jgi:MFS family permease